MLKFGSKSDVNVTYKCTVRLLEDTEIVECEFQPQHKGKYLVEHVCRQLNLIEKDYFGLRYVDSSRQRHWLDPAKLVLKQVKDMDPILFSFRVKFYPPDPFRLKEEITRYQVYLQVKRDLLHGRLYCSPTDSGMLGAYVVQAELGNYDPEEHVENYVSEMKILLKQTELLEEKMMELHRTLKGQSPAATETSFLRKACALDTYGVDPHPVKDVKGNQLYLGINHLGILTFQGSRKTNHFRWVEVHKINYEGRMFIIHLIYQEKKTTVGFKCPTGAACRHVWRCAVEQMLFFTLPSSADVPSVVTGGSFFSWNSSKFRYSGRVEKEILEEGEKEGLRRDEPTITRSSLRRKASSVPATPSTPVANDLGYSSLPRSNHSADCRLESGGGGGLDAPDNSIPLETVAEDQEIKHRGGASERVNKSVSEPRLNGKIFIRAHKDTDSSYGDYYVRDSIDHSSSESQLVGSLRGSRSPTPVLRGGRLPLPRPPVAPPTARAPARTRSVRIVRILMPSLFVATVSLFLLIILVLETDFEVLGPLRRAPEMIALRRLYYEPAKGFVRSKFSSRRDT